jgi:hypothetical protein
MMSREQEGNNRENITSKQVGLGMLDQIGAIGSELTPIGGSSWKIIYINN